MYQKSSKSLNELKKRREKLRSSIEGNVSNFLKNFIKSDLTQSVSKHQSKRINKALTQKIILYPSDRGIYVAYSEETDTTYIISQRPASCTCNDFMYNCDYKSGECCKHIWKLRAMMSIDALPSRDDLPNLWTLACIQNDLTHADNANKDLTKLRQELTTLQKEIARTDWYNVDYREVYSKWYKILDDAELE